MFKQFVEEICDAEAGADQQVTAASAKVNQAIDAASISVGVRLCVGLGVVAAALADLPDDARREISYRLIASMLGAEPVEGEAGSDCDISGDLTVTGGIQNGKPMAA